MSLEESDAAAAAVQKTPNRVTLDYIRSRIAYEHVYTLDTAGDEARWPNDFNPWVHTCCAMVLKNGFVVFGHSAPADPENYNAELGAKFAREDCIRQIWKLEAYLLREQMMDQGASND
jgi:hypothetical protein